MRNLIQPLLKLLDFCTGRKEVINWRREWSPKSQRKGCSIIDLLLGGDSKLLMMQKSPEFSANIFVFGESLEAVFEKCM